MSLLQRCQLLLELSQPAPEHARMRVAVPAISCNDIVGDSTYTIRNQTRVADAHLRLHRSLQISVSASVSLRAHSRSESQNKIVRASISSIACEQ